MTRSLVDAYLAAAFLTATTGRTVTPGQIRQWASRGEVARHGTRGRLTLYDLRELQTRANAASDTA